MINYTERITALMADVVARVGALSFIDVSDILVFARFGRSGAEGAYATCHSLNLPTSEPGYYFWRDRRTGHLTRRSEWFVTKTPEVCLRGNRIDYLISFSVPRFCEQTLAGTPKESRYPGFQPWIAKLDTVVHELFHIDPAETGIRKMERSDGKASSRCHSPEFFDTVARFVREYLATDPDPKTYDFLKHDFAGLAKQYGGVVGTTFRNFPSFPQRYLEALHDQPDVPESIKIVPLKRVTQPTRYTEDDLCVRQFVETGCRRVGFTARRLAA
jgi:hypothetical protein